MELYLCRIVKSIKVINYKELAQLQLEEGAKPVAEITEEMLWENSKLLQTRRGQETDWKLTMETLTLTHSRLASMRGIAALLNLRQLNLSHNMIEKIEAVQHCRLLEELNLEENKITKIEKLEGLVYLKKLELGKNKIARIEGISNLQNLMQLSL